MVFRNNVWLHIVNLTKIPIQLWSTGFVPRSCGIMCSLETPVSNKIAPQMKHAAMTLKVHP